MLKYGLLSFLSLCALCAQAQDKTVTVSGTVRDTHTQQPIPLANIALRKASDGQMVQATVSQENGAFSLQALSGNYLLDITAVGYKAKQEPLFVGALSDFLDLGIVGLPPDVQTLDAVTVTAAAPLSVVKLDKKVFSLADNLTQAGGSVLQALQNLPGVTLQEGKLQLRGSDKVAVLVDGRQTALTGFGSQSGLDNIPASAIDRIEIINNPAARYDANGNAGIINIIYKKNKKEGLNGKASMTSGTGSLWERRQNLPDIRPQYRMTPKVNPGLSLNYRKGNWNAYFQGDYLYTETLNKNEFLTRTYNDGSIVHQQTKRNRDTHFTTIKTGLDWQWNEANTITVSGMFGSEKIMDNGDQPFFNRDFSQRLRLWQFLEDELKTTAMATVAWQRKFAQPGHVISAAASYTFHREDEQYFFDNFMPDYTGKDAFKLLSDEKVIDLNVDYTKPFKSGRLEVGAKLRQREIPTNMQFFPGFQSPLDASAGGWATYREIIPALYGNYVYERPKIEAELGLRMEYIKLRYEVNPNHPVYKTDGYDYTEPFPNLRLAYKFNPANKLSLFYNRRVDRPNEVDIRIFPKYDDAEIIKVGNPALRPQFTNTLELGFRHSQEKGYLQFSIFHKSTDGTIARIATTAPGSNLIYAVFQNADESYSNGAELVYAKTLTPWFKTSLNGTVYHNTIDAFEVNSLYPVAQRFTIPTQKAFSGNLKSNNSFELSKSCSAQLTAVWLAPDIIPQGRIGARFSLDAGLRKRVQDGKGEWFVNATDLANTLVLRKTVTGTDFRYSGTDYYETQVVRLGYSYKF